MNYEITSFDHNQGTFVVLYSDGAYIILPAPRKDGVYCTGELLENYIQGRHPSVWQERAPEIAPLLEEDLPGTDLPNEIVEKAALYQPLIS